MSKITTRLLDARYEPVYQEFLNHSREALIYHSLQYRNFLKNVLEGSTDQYILAYEDENLAGVLPTFVKTLENGSSIVNSLPFFGSHGGILISENTIEKENIKTTLINKFFEIAENNNAISVTLIDNPLDPNEEFYKYHFKKEPIDVRISQITDISVDNLNHAEEELFLKFHSKTRNMIRKGLKTGFNIYHEESEEALNQLYYFHVRNMTAIKGFVKPLKVFKELLKSFEANKDYRIYLAETSGEIAAALLVFYYKNFCEYYTPAINECYRSSQPLSVLILNAMKDAVFRGIKYWNWGGTWLNQDGVYLFKKRWGTQERHYSYFNIIRDEKLYNYTKKDLFDTAPYYYVLNYKCLKNNV